ncbi:hypothetical protein IE53DRAFT_369158 [Violaceomyces palustris]|uniref:Uncharacterized protein n=1 Tax=Violaceomyces palustris TaxID=1673888 RepID=A0ACD0NWE7_9BASI|nr:hypothetical protein IE53DRAFT_369158 [Violaceomyces palustris]
MTHGDVTPPLQSLKLFTQRSEFRFRRAMIETSHDIYQKDGFPDHTTTTTSKEFSCLRTTYPKEGSVGEGRRERSKLRILVLHGKGTSARIMRAQIKAITDALADEAEFEFLQGHVDSQPYHGIERLFPNQEYKAWYENPSPKAIEAAHKRVLSAFRVPTCLHQDGVRIAREGKQKDCSIFLDELPKRIHHQLSPLVEGKSNRASLSSDQQHQNPQLSLLTPPQTPKKSSSRSSSTIHSRNSSNGSSNGTPTTDSGGCSAWSLAAVAVAAGRFQTDGFGSEARGRMNCRPNRVSPMTPPPEFELAEAIKAEDRANRAAGVGIGAGKEAKEGSFDGVLCFSQGCAVVAGMLLEKQWEGAKFRGGGGGGNLEDFTIKFAIFICGGRPFKNYQRFPKDEANDGEEGRSGRGAQQLGSNWTRDAYGGQRSVLAAATCTAAKRARIAIPTLHVLGSLDPGYDEGRKLYQSCDRESRRLIEFEGGHCPPRKSTEVDKVVDAIRALMRDCGGL